MRPHLLFKIGLLSLLTAVASAESVAFQTWTGSYDDGVMTMTATVMVPKQETRTQEYTVKVPYIETVTQGGEKRQVTKYRTETRTRQYAVVTYAPETRTRAAKLESLNLQTIDGEKIPIDKLKMRFAKTTTVLQIPEGATITATMKALLKEDTIVHVAAAPKEKKPLKTPPPPIAPPPPKPIERPKPVAPPTTLRPAAPSQSLQTWQGKIEGENLTLNAVVQVPYTEQVEQTYTVQVPVEKQIEKDDGTTQTIKVFQTQQRARTVNVTKYRQVERQKAVPSSAWAALNLQDLKGNKLTTDEITKAFASETIVLQVPPEGLSAEVRSLLKESVVLQELSAPKRGGAPVAPPKPIP